VAHVLFLDESGQDHRESPYEVLGGIAVEDSRIWPFITDLRRAEEQHFGCRVTASSAEIKAKKLLKTKVFRHARQAEPIAPDKRTELARQALEEGRAAVAEERPSRHTRDQLTALAQAKIAFCETAFELCARHQARAFASIVAPHARAPSGSALRKDYSYLFERFYAYLEDVPRFGREQGIVVGTPARLARAPGAHVRAQRAHNPHAEAVRTLRYRRPADDEHPHTLWGFVYIDDLRPRSERQDGPK